MAQTLMAHEVVKKRMKIQGAIKCPACGSMCWTRGLALQRCPMCRATFSNIKHSNLMHPAEAVTYPCRHATFGCKQFHPKKALAEHEGGCAFKPYPCLIRAADGKRCTWSGILAHLYAHAVGEHPKCAWMREQNTDIWKPGRHLDDEVQIVKAHDKIFYFTRRIVKDVVHWSLNIVGPSRDADEFVLQLQFRRNKSPMESLRWMQQCKPFQARAVHVEDFGLGTAFIKKFENQSRRIPYKVIILKKGGPGSSDVDCANY